MNLSLELHQIDLYSQLSQLFHLGFRFIKAKNTEKPQWETISKYELKDGGFIKDYASVLFLLGVSFGAETLYTLMDIDINSPYHPANNPKAFQKLLHTLEKKGLTHPVLIQSSYSGGIHVYFFFPKKLHTFRVASLIHVTLVNAGFKLRPGHLEIFPNPKPYSTNGKFSNYKAHRLPLQPESGSYLLDRWGELIMNIEGLTHLGQVSMFLREAEASAQAHQASITQIEGELDWAYQLYTKFIAKYQHLDRNYSEAAREWLEDLQLSMGIGWTGKGQTNQMLQIFVVYGIVFKGLEDKQDLFNWVHETVLETRGYKEHCRHQHEIEKRIWDWVNASIDNEHYVCYCGFPARRGISIEKLVRHIQQKERKPNAHNQRTAERTLDRLTAILVALGTLPRLVTERIAAIQAKSVELFAEKISRDTLYDKKYRLLWNGDLATVISSDSAKDPTLIVKSLENKLEARLTEKISEINLDLENQQSIAKHEFSYPNFIYEVYESERPVGSFELVPDMLLDVLDRNSAHVQDDESQFSLAESIPIPKIESSLTHLESQSIISLDADLAILATETELIKITYRTVATIAAQVRASNYHLTDELLLEMINHPELEQIERLLELGNRLLGASCWTDLEDLARGLLPVEKQDLWNTLTTQEQATVRALKVASEVLPMPTALPDNSASNHATIDSSACHGDLSEPVVVASEVSASRHGNRAEIEIGTRLQRNRLDLHQGKCVELLQHCEVIGRSGLNWVVRSPDGDCYNVSPFALSSGEWEVELAGEVVADNAQKVPGKSLTIESMVRAVTGLIGRIVRVYKYSSEPYAIEDDLGKVHRFSAEDLFPT
jgi:hypothetical protein